MTITEKIATINRLLADVHAYKAEHPEECLAHYSGNPGSILNAYREGDISFGQAIRELRGPRECGRPGELPYAPEPAIPVLEPLTCKVRMPSARFPLFLLHGADSSQEHAAMLGAERPTLKRTPPELPDFGAAELEARRLMDAE